MSNKANQESICTNGTRNTLQSPQGAENRAGTQTLVDTSAEQKGRDLYIQAESCHDRAAPPAEQQDRWVERWHGSGGKEFWEGWSILNAANREMIAHLGPDVDPDAVRGIVAAHNEALCGECAGTGGRWCPACAGATPPAEQQAAPKAAPGEQNTVPAEWLEQAYREGWAACRDAETIGEEAEDWAFGNSTANSRVIDAQQAAPPQQEAQEPAHPSCKSDMTVNGGALKLALNVLRRAGKTEVADELEKTAQPAPATQQAGDVVAYLDVGASGYLDLGAALSEDALQQLPKGRHALVIAGTYGIDGYVAAPQPSPMAQAAESVPAIQGEMNVQLDIDSNHSAPGQQRDMACSLALGQPVGNGSDQVAGHPSAQEDKLLTVAERNIRSFLRSATFKSESDREAALNCVDVLWEAARATAESVQEDAARYRWLREGNDAKHGAAWHVAVNLYGCEWDSAIDAARKQGASDEPRNLGHL